MTAMETAIALLNAARDYLEKDAQRITVTAQDVRDIAEDIGTLLERLEALMEYSTQTM